MSSVSPAYSPKTPSSELSHAAIGQWGAVIAGVLAGFAVTIVLATLGGAIGLTTGVAVDSADEGTAEAIGGAALGWLLVSALVVGIVGGTVLARSSRPDRAFHAGMLGLVTWTGGVLLAVLVAAPAAAGLVSGMGASAGVATSYFVPQRNVLTERWSSRPADASTPPSSARPADAAGTGAGSAPMTAEERTCARAAAEDATRAAMIAAWTAVVAQLVSLFATILAARLQRRRLVAREPVGYAMPATHGAV